VKATQPEGGSPEGGLEDGNGKAEGGVERLEEKIQDVLVPWVLRSKPKPRPKPKSKPKSKSKPSSTTTLSNDNEDQNENTKNDPVDEKEEEKEEEKVFNRYYHLFIEGELRDLIHQAGEEEGYRILPPISSSSTPSSSSLPSSTSTSTSTSIPSTTSTKNDQKEINGESGDGKWLRIRGEGWEADNWWVEAEVGVGDGQ